MLCIIGVAGVIASNFFRFSQRPSTQPPITHYESDMAATGLSFVEFEGAKKKKSFKIKEINVAKKKLGFLRIAFWKVAEIDGFEINMYLAAGSENKGGHDFDFGNHMLSPQFMNAVDIESVKELKINNFSAKIFKNRQLISSIMSDRASISIFQKNFVFSGNIVIQAGNRRMLTCQSMKYLQNEKKFKIMDTFRFIAGERSIEGKSVVTDILLENIKPISTFHKSEK